MRYGARTSATVSDVLDSPLRKLRPLRYSPHTSKNSSQAEAVASLGPGISTSSADSDTRFCSAARTYFLMIETAAVLFEQQQSLLK